MKLNLRDESGLGKLGRATSTGSISNSGFGARREYFKKQAQQVANGEDKMTNIATEHIVIGALIAWFAFK